MSNDHQTLSYINGSAASEQSTASSWSIVPPKAVRQAFFRRIRKARRPAGTLALPAITTTGTVYYTGVVQATDVPMALGLTALVVLYDSVIAVCRTWRAGTATGAAPADNNTAGKSA